MMKRGYSVAIAGALVLATAGTSHAQFFGGFGSFGGFGGWGAMSPWSGTGGWAYSPNGMGFNYYSPYAYSYSPYAYSSSRMGFGYPGMGMGAFPYMNSGYGIPSSVAFSPMSYVAFYPPVYTTRAPVVAPASGLQPASQPATIEVIVPADAVVVFDGQQTTQTGTHRVYTTPDLIKGESYHYTVTATFTQNGKPVTQSQKVRVYAGGSTSVVFLVAK
jgi:uncharacterized protein (TIGR03000 family)